MNKPSARRVRRLLLGALFLVATSFPATGAEPNRMTAIGLEEWSAVLEAQRGDIVVVDLWASWCVSCIERFPEMADMARRYDPRGVRFLTLNLDDPRDDAGIAWAEEFLARFDAPLEHYHLDENLRMSFERLDLIAIPVVLIYDAAGAERFRLTNDDPNDQFDEADIEGAVQGLLAGGS